MSVSQAFDDCGQRGFIAEVHLSIQMASFVQAERPRHKAALSALAEPLPLSIEELAAEATARNSDIHLHYIGGAPMAALCREFGVSDDYVRAVVQHRGGWRHG